MASIDFKGDIVVSNHDITGSLLHMDPTYMTYNSGPMWLLIALVVWHVVVYAKEIVLEDEEDEDDGLVEGLDCYYDALKKSDKAAYIGHEEYFMKYGVRTLSDD